ncbi:MAG: VWA domain-containing protein, partial [Proteobacteria bacterium]|nr:VWA domain-containing protein [Pseudomonadota bacterium]
FVRANEADEKIDFVHYLAVRSDDSLYWSRNEFDSAPLPLHFWNKRELPCDGYSDRFAEEKVQDLYEFAKFSDFGCYGPHWIPEGCTVHDCTIAEGCDFSAPEANRDEMNLFGSLGTSVIREGVNHPRILFLYSWTTARQYMDALLDKDINRKFSVFYRTAKLSQPWGLSTRGEARSNSGKALNGYGVFAIEGGKTYYEEGVGLNVLHTISSWDGRTDPDASDAHPYGIYTRSTLIPWPPGDNGLFSVLLVDRSGSMYLEDGSSGMSRMEDAKESAREYLKISTENRDYPMSPDHWFDETASIMKFNTNTDCYNTSDGTWLDARNDECNFDEVTTQNLDDLYESFDHADFSPDGNTALLTAIEDSIDQIVAKETEGGKLRTIYLISDGCENSSGGTSVETVVQKLHDEGITLNAIAVGESADVRFLEDLTSTTELYATQLNGQSLNMRMQRAVSNKSAWAHAPNADAIPNVLAGMQLRNNDGTLLIPLQSVDSSLRQYVTAATFQVEAGARELDIVLANHGPKQREGQWVVFPRLVHEDSQTVIEIEPFGDPIVIPDEITYKMNVSMRIRVPNPTGGDWKLELFHPSALYKSYLTVGVVNPSAKLRIFADPAIVDNEGDADKITVVPVISYGDMGLDPIDANCNGEVFGPSGYHGYFDVVDSQACLENGMSPCGIIDRSTLSGRGTYRIEVSCEMEGEMKSTNGTPTIVPRFVRKESTHFFFNTPIMPPFDSNKDDQDGDGILDVDEQWVDNDGDGFIAPFDPDDDNDDWIDDPSIDPDSTNPNIPGSTVLFVANGYYPEESYIYNHLVDIGYDVVVKKDYKIKSSTDLSQYNLVLVTGFSPNISNSGINNIENSDIPVFVIEYWDFWYSYKFGLVDDNWCGTMYTTIVELTDYDHEITSGMDDQEIVYDTQSVMIGAPMYSIKPGTTPLIYSTVQYDQATVLVNESKDIVVTGIHQADNYTSTGWEIFDNSIEYIMQ